MGPCTPWPPLDPPLLLESSVEFVDHTALSKLQIRFHLAWKKKIVPFHMEFFRSHMAALLLLYPQQHVHRVFMLSARTHLQFAYATDEWPNSGPASRRAVV